MKYILILMSFLILSCSNNNSKSNAENATTRHIDTLTYSYKGYAHGMRLDLLSDGRFINENYVFASHGWGRRKIAYGTFVIDSVNLVLTPLYMDYTMYSEEDTIEPKAIKIKYGVDSLKIRTEFKIVSWERNKYLLSDNYDPLWRLSGENDYTRFAYDFNSGYEPKSSGMYLVNKPQDSITSEFDLNQIPPIWRDYFLKEPISANIKKIKRIVESNSIYGETVFWLIEINKGEKDKIKKGLNFKTKGEGFYIDIDSVMSTASYGRTYSEDFIPRKFPIGTELRTRWE